MIGLRQTHSGAQPIGTYSTRFADFIQKNWLFWPAEAGFAFSRIPTRRSVVEPPAAKNEVFQISALSVF
jgi:hypothetical protein